MRSGIALGLGVAFLHLCGLATADEKADLIEFMKVHDRLVTEARGKVEEVRKEIADLEEWIRVRENDTRALTEALESFTKRLKLIEKDRENGVPGAQERLAQAKADIDREIKANADLIRLRIQDFSALRMETKMRQHPDPFVPGWRKKVGEKREKELPPLEKGLAELLGQRWELQRQMADLEKPPQPARRVPFVCGWQIPTHRVAVDIPVPLDVRPDWILVGPNGSLLFFNGTEKQAEPYLDLLKPHAGSTAEDALKRFEAATDAFGRLMSRAWREGFEKGPVRSAKEDSLVRVVLDGRTRYEYRHPEPYGDASLGWIGFCPLPETLPLALRLKPPPKGAPASDGSVRFGYHTAWITLAPASGDVFRAVRLLDVQREVVVDTVKGSKPGEETEIPVTTAYARARAAAVEEEQRKEREKPVKLPDPKDSSPYFPTPEPDEFRRLTRFSRMHDSTAEYKKVLGFLLRSPGCTTGDMMKVLRPWAYAMNELFEGPRWLEDDYSPLKYLFQFLSGCKAVGTVESYALMKNLARKLRELSVAEPRLAGLADMVSVHMAGLSISLGEWDRAGKDLALVGKRQPWWPTPEQLKKLAARMEVK